MLYDAWFVGCTSLVKYPKNTFNSVVWILAGIASTSSRTLIKIN